MVDTHWKAKMAVPEISLRSPKISDKSYNSVLSPRCVGSSAKFAYEHYLRLPELSKLWSSREFPDWKNEPILKPALQALEITFRFISVSLSDTRPYANRREWTRRLESIAMHQIELIAAVCEEEEPHGDAPIVDLTASEGMLMRDRSSQEVWKLPGATPMVNRTSEASLLPRLASWETSEGVASKILLEIECQMRRSPFTLGLGEPNLSGKPNLDYDLVCRPSDLHALKKTPFDSKNLNNHENNTLYMAHQILESWLFMARQRLRRICERIDVKEWEKASSDCWLLERVWKLLSEVEDLHLLMDPDDFLRLKNQLAIKATPPSEPFYVRSATLLELMRCSKDLKGKVPWILGVEVDPKGGPRLQEAAMRLVHGRGRGEEPGRIHLLQAFQAVEAAVKKFFFSYRQLIAAVMGSLEASGNQVVGIRCRSCSWSRHIS